MFENIIGHNDNKNILKKSIENGNISHSYLFEGKDGIGKKLMAFEFAKNILKVNDLKSTPDFKYIQRNEGKKDIVIEQVREKIIDDIYIAPAAATKKVYIIDDAKFLNVAAQNALLKTLEEPPSYVVIILISSNSSSLLPTIISRVNKISFLKIEDEKLSEYIYKNYGIALEKKHLKFFDGSIGQAQNVIKNSLLDKFNLVDDLYECISKKDVIKAYKISKDVDFTNGIILNYFEYILYMNNKFDGVLKVEKASQRLKYNGNYDIVIDNMILKIIDSI